MSRRDIPPVPHSFIPEERVTCLNAQGTKLQNGETYVVADMPRTRLIGLIEFPGLLFHPNRFVRALV
jgi:hypothetical protein